MILHVIGSSSAGNGYVLKGGEEALIIECGVPLMEVLRVTGYNTGSIAGAIVSHKHGDHAGNVEKYLHHAIKVYAGDQYFDKSGRQATLVTHNQEFKVGDFTIKALEVEHDVSCYAFLIHHPECGRVFFVTDTHYVKYRPRGINHLILECNYSEHILEDNVISGRVEPIVRNRVINSHMSLETCIKWLRAIDTSKVRNIVLTHLSNTNADGDRFADEVVGATGKIVHVARPGLTVPMSLKHI